MFTVSFRYRFASALLIVKPFPLSSKIYLETTLFAMLISLLIAYAVTPALASLITSTKSSTDVIPVDKLIEVVTLDEPEKSVIDRLPVKLALVVLINSVLKARTVSNVISSC